MWEKHRMIALLYAAWPWIKPATWVCALTRNRTHNLAVYRTTLQPSHTGQGLNAFLNNIFCVLKQYVVPKQAGIISMFQARKLRLQKNKKLQLLNGWASPSGSEWLLQVSLQDRGTIQAFLLSHRSVENYFCKAHVAGLCWTFCLISIHSQLKSRF